MPVFSVYFWNLESGTPRHEALMDAVVKAREYYQAPVVDSVCCKQCVQKTARKAFWFRADTCSSRRQEKRFQSAEPKVQMES